jgi:hypothetical protein
MAKTIKSKLATDGFFCGELEPDAIVGGCIAIYENAWPNPEQVISSAEAQCNNGESGMYFKRAGTFDEGANQEWRTNYVCPITEIAAQTANPVAQQIHNQYRMLLNATALGYVRTFGIAEQFWQGGYDLLKYSGGQEYHTHYDSGPAMRRMITSLCYLNDDYEGGELEFPNFNVKIKPKPGMLILFPSTFAYAHKAYPVSEGTKYTLVTWLTDTPVQPLTPE